MQEERDCYIGQIFGMMSILRSQCEQDKISVSTKCVSLPACIYSMTKTYPLQSCTCIKQISLECVIFFASQSLDTEWLGLLITRIMELSKKKSYLQELCAKVIVDIFTLVSTQLMVMHNYA